MRGDFCWESTHERVMVYSCPAGFSPSTIIVVVSIPEGRGGARIVMKAKALVPHWE
jgi:hypothetical protein